MSAFLLTLRWARVASLGCASLALVHCAAGGTGADASAGDTSVVTDTGANPEASAGDGGSAEANCLATGGTITMGACCMAVGDFPNQCREGACGCGPTGSHSVRVCQCPTGTCFDGTGCVAR